MTERSPASRVYRARRSDSITGFVGVIGFPVMVVFSVAVLRMDGSAPALLWIGAGTFFLMMFLMALWLTLDSLRGRLILGDLEIVQHGVLSSRRLRIADVTHVSWRRFPRGGSILLRGDLVRIRINIETYTPSQQNAVIEFIRSAVASDRQHGWSLFVASRRPSSPPS